MINKRVFGSDIPTSIKKKLEARQHVAEGNVKPTDSITSNYPDDRTSKYKYNELISSNFEMEGDLSSRTPFARMWTAVALVNEREFQLKDDIKVGVEGLKKALNAEETAKRDEKLTAAQTVLQKIKYKELDRNVYVIGTNNLSTVQTQNPLDSQQDSEHNLHQAVFPDEHNVIDDNNKFLKPAAGITSVSSETEGTLGTIKKTEVSFIVHNFADYDKIYNKFFMRPGAHVFVDFGWDALKDAEGNPIPLYDPREILSLPTDKAGEKTPDSVNVEHKLYGVAGKSKGVDEDGFVAKCRGDVETINGIVTGYESKILENGSVECSVEITSKNQSLLLYPKYSTNNPVLENAKFEFEMDSLIFYEQLYNYAGNEERESLINAVDTLANTTNAAGDQVKFQKLMEQAVSDSFGADILRPGPMSIMAGLFVQRKDNNDSYISWGLLEDRIFNKFFGHGDSLTNINSDDDDGKMAVKMDSSDGFTTVTDGFYTAQGLEGTEPPPFILPDFWDFSYNHPFGNNFQMQKSGLNRKERAAEFAKKPHYNKKYKDINLGRYSQLYKELRKLENELLGNFRKGSADYFAGGSSYSSRLGYLSGGLNPSEIPEKSLITSYDRYHHRIPIREVFVNIQIVKDAFTKEDNETLRDIVEDILGTINEHSMGAWNWKLVGEENILKINDRNYSHSLIGTTKNERKADYDDLFVFNVMSKNSIVKSYDVSLEMPDGEIGSMYAIQAMSGTPTKMIKASHILERQSVLQSLLSKYSSDPEAVVDNINDIGFKYLPDMGSYNIAAMDSDNLDNIKKAEYYKKSQLIKPKGRRRGIIPSLTSDGVHVATTKIGVIPTLEDNIEAARNEIKKAAAEDTKPHSTETRMQVALDTLANNGVPVFDDIDEFSTYLRTGNIQLKSSEDSEQYFKAVPLPIKLELTTYGISSLKPGDIFRVDYLPEVYLSSVYFQIMGISHEVGTDGWYTSLETQFVVSPHRYEDTNMSAVALESETTIKRMNLEKLLRNEGFNDEQVKSVCNLAAPTPKKDESIPPEPVLNPAALKGGQLLTSDINDNMAFRDEKESAGFACAYKMGKHGGQHKNNYNFHRCGTGFSDYDSTAYQHKGGCLPSGWKGGNSAKHKAWWTYPVAKYMDKPPSVHSRGYNSNIRTTQVIVNLNFETLRGYMINLKLLTAADLGFDPYYCKFFSFEIFAEASIMITNPVYAYWGGVDRYDGYGYWGTVGRRKNTAFPTVQGVYNPGEKVHLVINEKSEHQETGGTMFWAVLPTSIALENYDINATDNRWDAEEWDKDKNSIKKYD